MSRLFPFLLLLAFGGMSSAGKAENLLVVANKRENTVSFIDLATGAELGRTGTGSTPHELAASPDGRSVAVVAYGGHSLDVIDVASRTLRRTIDLGRNGQPHGIRWLGDGRIVVTTQASRSVVVIDTRRHDAQSVIRTGQKGTHLLAVSPDGNRLYAANRESGTVSVIDLRHLANLRDVPAGTWPEGIALTNDGRELWVADFQNASVLVFDTRNMRLSHRLATGPSPIRVASAPDGRHVYVSDTKNGSVREFDRRTHRRVRDLKVSGDEDAEQVTLAFSPDSRRLYVAETARNTIAEVDLKNGAVRRRLKGGDGGDGLAIIDESGR